MQIFAKEVMEKVRELDTEKMKTEKAFHDFLPKTIVRDLKRKRVKQVPEILMRRIPIFDSLSVH